MKLLFQFSFYLITILSYSQNKISACYGSNFAVVGWIGTHIKFNQDSSFVYRCAGDMFYDKVFGEYRVEGKFVYLDFNEEIRDTIMLSFSDSLGTIRKISVIEPPNPNIVYRTSKFKIKGNKLLLMDQKSKIIRSEVNFQGKKRKYFLVSHKEHNIKDW